MWIFSFLTALLFSITYIAIFKFITTEKINLKYLFLVAVLSFSFSTISIFFTELEFGNRIQHAVGGGFLVVLMLFLVVRNAKLDITKVQFFLFGVMLATTLGVFYELLEMLGEFSTNIVFQTGIYDTWLDLLSNTAGAFIGGAVLSLFLKK